MFSPKVIRVIMDGWGYSKTQKGNAVFLAKTPTFDFLWSNYLHTLIHTFGQSVGLPWGATGSSEVGHKSIGSGEKILQEYSMINQKLNDPSFLSNFRLLRMINTLKKNHHPLHLIGLVSDGGVHSHTSHILLILKFLRANKFQNQIYLQAITDGRDCDAKSSEKYIDLVLNKAKEYGLNLCVASISGRYYAMDRNNDWQRTKKGYDCMTLPGEATKSNYKDIIENSYKNNLTDEFIIPEKVKVNSSDELGFWSRLLHRSSRSRGGEVQPGDGVIFFNIRADRMRQLVECFALGRKKEGIMPVKRVNMMCLTTYNEDFPVPVLFPTKKIKDPLAKILSDNNLTQAHFAESEKYAHVTYFFNGENTKPFANEEWVLVPSPKVATFDLAPEMSAKKITDKVIAASERKQIDFILINYANADMVGHTGKLNPTIKAVECVDHELERLTKAFPDSTIIITADHGNAESKIDPILDEPQTNHTTNPVPFILVGEEFKNTGKSSKYALRQMGSLTDITATILYLFNIEPAKEMEGVNLIDRMR